MSDRDDILRTIRAGLKSGIPTSVSSQTAACDLFEVYVFDLFLVAGVRAGASVQYEDIDNNKPTRRLFRTNPGWIYRKSGRTGSAASAFTHAVLTFSNSPALELHTGIYAAGQSLSLHELDVAVIDRAEAQFCRLRRISPRHTKVVLGAECKFHTCTRINLGIGRAFFGLVGDFPGVRLQLVTNIDSKSVEYFLTRKKKEPDFAVVPRNHDRVERLVGHLERGFTQYQAANPIRRPFSD